MKNTLYSTFAIITLSLTLSVVNCGVIQGDTYTVDANQATSGNTFQTLEELANSVILKKDDVVILCNDDASLVSNISIPLAEIGHSVTFRSNDVNSPRTITRSVASTDDGGVFSFPNLGTLNLEGIAVFDGNEVSSSGSSTGRGGAFATLSLTFTGNDHIVFSNNLANGGNDNYSGLGGAIFAESGLTFSYNNSGYSFVSNKAQGSGNHSGHGGAIYVGTPESPTTFAGFYMSANSHFKANRADNDGGAIYLSGVSVDATFYGDTFFQDNIAGRNGGAIYINGDGLTGSALLRLYTHNNHVVFSGNTAQGVSNSIFMEKNSSLQIIGDHNVYFDDPISSGPLGGNSLQKFGSGIVQFVGNSVLNSGGEDGNVQHTEGTFRIVDGATFSTHNATSDATFSMDADAILAGGGTISADKFTLKGIISPDSDILLPPTWNDATQSFGIVNSSINAANNIGKLTLVGDVELSGTKIHVDLKSGNVSDLVMVDGTISFDANVNTINVAQFKSGTFDVLKTTNGTLNLSNFNVRVKDSAATGSRLTAVLQLANGDQTLQLKTTSTANSSLTWTGSSGSTWDIDTTSSWIDSGGVTTFIDGDQVLFNDTPVLRNITIVDPGVIVTQMTVMGNNDYTFSGGGIRATTDSTFSTLGTRTGKLIKTGDGVLTLNTANEFEGGIELSGGTIVLGNDKALGTWNKGSFSVLTLKQGTLLVAGATSAGTVRVNDDRTVTNIFQIGTQSSRNGSLTFDIAAGKTLTIAGVETTSSSVGAIMPYCLGGEPLKFTGGGNLVICDSTSTSGIRVSSTGVDDLTMNFKGLNSVAFSNLTTVLSTTQGGGIHIDNNYSKTDVQFGDNVSFFNNTASTGGGINLTTTGAYSVSLELGDNLFFANNKSTYGGGLGGGGISLASGSGDVSLVMGNNAVFQENFSSGHGGAIFVKAGTIGSITLGNNYVFKNNTANAKGSAIYLETATAELELGNNIVFANNTAANTGGAIHVISSVDATVTLGTNTLFENNVTNNTNSYRDVGHKYAF